MTARELFYGYRYALTRPIPVSKTRYIRAMSMVLTGWAFGLGVQALLIGWWSSVALWVGFMVLTGWPRKYQRAKRDTDD